MYTNKECQDYSYSLGLVLSYSQGAAGSQMFSALPIYSKPVLPLVIAD